MTLWGGRTGSNWNLAIPNLTIGLLDYWTIILLVSIPLDIRFDAHKGHFVATLRSLAYLRGRLVTWKSHSFKTVDKVYNIYNIVVWMFE